MSIDPNSLTAGMLLDGFRLEEKLHRGGMAALWRVTREDISFPLVMKVPRLKYGDDPTALIGFEVEQMIMPRLSGLHVPRFVAAGDFSVCPYVVMEYLEGESLHARLKTRLPIEEIAAIGAKVASAVHEIHRQHVIHLDLKPANVLFRETGEAVLIDFGLACHDQLPDLLAEEFRLPMGTSAYMSPEQVLQVRRDPRSDHFALGAILYELVTGVKPFGKPTNVRGLRKRLYRDPVPPRAINGECPEWLQEVIMRCLEVNPEKRYFSAALIAYFLKNPDYVDITSRGRRTRRDGFFAVAKRWLQSFEGEPGIDVSVAQRLNRAPIIMVAVDTSPAMEAINEALRDTVGRLLQTEKESRLACVTVRKVPRVAIDLGVDRDGKNLNVQRLVELKYWAAALKLPPDRISFHVIEGANPADALIEHARLNYVDHVVIGGHGNMKLLERLGSVSSRVVAEISCTVTVVRSYQNKTAAS